MTKLSKSDKKNAVIVVRIDADLRKKLVHIADFMGVSVSTLVRMWIVEKVRAFDNESEPAVVKKSSAKR